MTPSYHGKRFRSVSSSAAGEVDGHTTFEYEQRGTIVSATYHGGRIAFGTLLATMAPDGSLDMRYQHVNDQGQLMTGVCQASLEILADGRYRLHEDWQWTCGARERGASVTEEVSRHGP